MKKQTCKSDQISIILATNNLALKKDILKSIAIDNRLRILATVTTGRKLIKLSRQLNPDVIISQVGLQTNNDGLMAAKSIYLDMPEIGIIILSSENNKTMLRGIVQYGAKGHLHNLSAKRQIVSAINKVYKQQIYFCDYTSDILKKFLTGRRITNENINELDILSIKQIRVVKLICEGYNNQEIAQRLGMAKRTVESIRDEIHKKTGTKNTARIVVYAIQKGIFDYNE